MLARVEPARPNLCKLEIRLAMRYKPSCEHLGTAVLCPPKVGPATEAEIQLRRWTFGLGHSEDISARGLRLASAGRPLGAVPAAEPSKLQYLGFQTTLALAAGGLGV